MSDLVEVERALRQLLDLGVVTEVHASLMHQNQLHLTTYQGSTQPEVGGLNLPSLK